MLAVLSNIINDHEMLSFSQEKQEKKNTLFFLSSSAFIKYSD